MSYAARESEGFVCEDRLRNDLASVGRLHGVCDLARVDEFLTDRLGGASVLRLRVRLDLVL